jgi:hypothetical protein
MPEVVRIHVPAGASMADVTCFQARHYVSSLPRPMRHWDADHKVWKVDVSLISRLASDLRAAGFDVLVDDDQDQAPDTWADQMYAALPRELADQAYRALTRILHPDLGVHGTHMTALNCARDKARA